MIKESLYFTFAGRKSSDYGILNVSIASGLYEESFMASRSIKEVYIRGKETPYLQEVTREPKSIPVSFAFQDTWNDDLINEVARWLDVEYYQPLVFSEEPEKVYYVMPVNESSVTHNGLKQGYLTLTFRCESPYSYSPMKVTPWYDFSTPTLSTLDIYNKGNKTILPEINIVKVGDGDLTITNLSNKGEVSKFTSLLDGEELYVHGENEIIETSLPNTYRFDSFNDNYLKLYYGKNILQIDGSCKIKFQYRYKFII